MHAFNRRAASARWPLAMTLAILAACAEDSTAPTVHSTPRPLATIDNVITVTTTSGGKEVGSLRWAAEAAGTGDVVRFDPSLAGATITIDSTIHVANAITIEGPANGGITVDGGGIWQVFFVDAALPNVTTFRNLSIVNGVGSGSAGGGGVLAASNIQLENVTLSGHHGDYSAALFTNANATLINSTISGNTTGTGGFAAALIVGTLTLRNTTIANNNHGGVDVVQALVLDNSILAGNGDAKNCLRDNVPTQYIGHDLVDDGSCGGAADVIIADAKLDALKDNGGPAKTHALLVGSPAIDAGMNCSVTTDERYVARDATCDLGAFEFGDFTTVAIAIDASGVLGKGNGWATVTGTVTCTGAASFSLSVELSQIQKDGKSTTDTRGAATVPVTCASTARPWSASVYLTSGTFKVGAATVMATTTNTPGGVKASSTTGAVKLLGGR